MKGRSAKKSKQYVTRRVLVAGLLAERPWCEIPGCPSRSEVVHEPLTRARGGDILDEDNCRAICNAHHSEIHDTEPEWAYAQGFLKHSWDNERRDGATNTAAPVPTSWLEESA